MNAASVLSFHDSIELFLQLVAEQKGIDGKSSFMGYFELIKAKMPPDGLTQKKSVGRINDARVALKHYGRLPSKLDIEEYRVTTGNFFRENTITVFGIEFEDVSLLSLIDDKEAREKLEEAEKLMINKQPEEALKSIAVAFDMLLENYEGGKSSHIHRSPFTFGDFLGFEKGVFSDIKDEKVAKVVDKIIDAVSEIQEALRIVSIGIDYRRYVKYKRIAPRPIEVGGKYMFFEKLYYEKAKDGDQMQDAHYCYDFVIETAIHLQEFDLNKT